MERKVKIENEETHRVGDCVDDSGKADSIVQLLLMGEDVVMRVTNAFLSFQNKSIYLHTFSKLTCSLSSFCCSRLLLSSSSTLLTWINLSFCTYTVYSQKIPDIITHKMTAKNCWNKTRSYFWCFNGFHMKSFRKPIKDEIKIINFLQTVAGKKNSWVTLTSSSESDISAFSETWRAKNRNCEKTKCMGNIKPVYVGYIESRITQCRVPSPESSPSCWKAPQLSLCRDRNDHLTD